MSVALVLVRRLAHLVVGRLADVFVVGVADALVLRLTLLLRDWRALLVVFCAALLLRSCAADILRNLEQRQPSEHSRKKFLISFLDFLNFYVELCIFQEFVDIFLFQVGLFQEEEVGDHRFSWFPDN